MTISGKSLKSQRRRIVNKLPVISIVCLLLASCSVQKFLPEGERLYHGAEIRLKKDPEVSTPASRLKSELALAASPKGNKFLFNQPYKVWWWYVLKGNVEKEQEKERGFRTFLRKKLGEAPVFSSRVNTKLNASGMVMLMENMGYFHSTAKGDTVSAGDYVKAVYDVHVKPRYTIKSVTWVKDSSSLLSLLESTQQQNSLIREGDPYRLSALAEEGERIDAELKNKGYYYFNPENIMVYADSTAGERQVDLFLNIKATTPPEARHPYRINRIFVFPNYSLASDRLDTAKEGMISYDSLLIKDTKNQFKNSLFANTVTYRPGDIYSNKEQNSTLNRFINLGAFKFVKNRFQPVKDSSGSGLLDAYYYLTPSKRKSIQGEVNAFSKENNFLGSQISLSVRQRNVFGGAELFTVRPYAGFEISFGDSIRNNNTYRAGTEVRLTFPRYAIPFIRLRENNFYPPVTNIVAGYEWLNRPIYYTKNLFHLQYDFTWKRSIRQQFTFAPFSLSFLYAGNITDSFYREAETNPSILLNVYNEAILGTTFNYMFSHVDRTGKNKWYYNAGLDLSGNVAGMLTGAKEYREKKVFLMPFAQYVKFDFDLHYTRIMANKWNWANRIFLGVANPYNNSRILPFAKQYTIGGSGSMRGFAPNSLGPGSHRPSLADQQFYQVIGGDYKLLGNTELRIPLVGRLSSAVFVDAGNIWTKDTIQFGPDGRLSRDWFKEIAVSSGVGFRFDFTVILLRFDFVIPLRRPYLPDGDRWVIDEINFGSKAWRKDNLFLNIAFGYPF